MSDAPITPQFQTKAPQIMRHIMSVLPLSDEDAAAVLGSFGVETGGFTLREESNGKGYGWAQWTGERRDDMEQWCAANDHDPYAESDQEYDEACMAFFLHEVIETWEKRVFTEGGTINGVFYPPIGKCTTLDAKTESFWRLYERPGTPHEDWRRDMAHEALRLYRGEPESKPMPYKSICISSGHSLYCRGANGEVHGGFDEVDEARRLVERVADELDARGVSVSVFHDNTSKTQSENLNTIVNWHNAQGAHDLNVSAHFNAFDGKAHGTEVLYLTQPELASEMSAAIATAGGFTNRGGKKRTDLAFLNKTKAPAILLETCFCDSAADAELYEIGFSRICDAIADVLGGKEATPPIEPPKPEPAEARVDIGVTGNVAIYVNGKLIQ